MVATVNGEEVTVAELRAELASVNTQDPKLKKAAEQAALMAIVRRRALAHAAKEQKLDRSPDYVIAKERAEELVLIRQLERKIAAGVPTPSRDEAEQYVSAHPDEFAQRKVFTVDEIRIGVPANQKLVDDLKRLNSQEEIAAKLTANNVPFARGTVTIDALSQDPRFIEAILRVQPKDALLFQDKGVLVAGVVRETKVVPFTGEPAVNYAINSLKQARVRETVEKALGTILFKANGDVQFNKVYAPAKIDLVRSTPTGAN